jgi:hypothetical protein
MPKNFTITDYPSAPVDAQMERSTFLGFLPTTNQGDHISSIDPGDPKLYWIFRDVDFIRWESEVHPQALLLFGAPPGCRMTDILLHIAKQATGTVFYFSCSSVTTTTFAHSILSHILNVSDDRQAKSIITTFLSTLLHKILQRDPFHFQDGDSSTTMAKVLYALGGELLEALTKAVDQVNDIQETSIIIDGIDKLGKEGAQFLQRFCSQQITSPKLKVLLVCQSDLHIQKLRTEGLCIEYDKERQGLGTFYALVESI